VLEIADDPAVEVDLVQVPAAVVQVVEFALVGQDQRLQVAQLVIAILQQASAVGIAEKLPGGVVGVVELLLFSFVVRKGDGQQVVGRVVAVVGGAIFGALAEKAADCVALEVMADGGRACRRSVVGQWRLFVRRGHMGKTSDLIQYVAGIEAAASPAAGVGVGPKGS